MHSFKCRLIKMKLISYVICFMFLLNRNNEFSTSCLQTLYTKCTCTEQVGTKAIPVQNLKLVSLQALAQSTKLPTIGILYLGRSQVPLGGSVSTIVMQKICQLVMTRSDADISVIIEAFTSKPIGKKVHNKNKCQILYIFIVQICLNFNY